MEHTSRWSHTDRMEHAAARSMSPMGKHSYMQAKHRVGSCHGSMDYSPSERAFHNTDVPARARQAVLDVDVRMPEKDKTRWRSDTTVFNDKPFTERRKLENFSHDPTEYEYNFRAEVLPKARPVIKDPFGRVSKLLLVRVDLTLCPEPLPPQHDDRSSNPITLTCVQDTSFKRTQEMPVNPKLDSKRLWESGTQLLEPEKQRMLADLTRRSQSATRTSTARLLSSSMRPRVSLVETERQRMERLRESRTAGYSIQSQDSLINVREHALGWEGNANIRNGASLRYEAYVPAASPSRQPPANSQEEEYEAVMRTVTDQRGRTMGATHRSRAQIRYKHEGVFQELPGQFDASNKPRRQWSCCASSEMSARGCVAVKHDPDRWCYDG